MEKFVPVKITDNRWAQRLLGGEVFMRPLYEFGVWNRNRDSSVSNDYRGDILEGTAAVYSDADEYPGIEGFPEDFREVVECISVTDYGDIPYFKIFSLYRLMYDPATNFFVRPDSRIADFGDTAVIIRDFNTFIERFAIALFSRYKLLSAMIDSVKFYDFSVTRMTDPLFSKMETYSYQNELRMAFCELEKDDFAVGEGADSAMRIVKDLSRVTLDIGSIRDIAVAVPVEDLIKLRFPQGIRLKFPSSDDALHPTNFDNIVEDTRKRMEGYRTLIGKPMFTI